jgi:hypothetical protein
LADGPRLVDLYRINRQRVAVAGALNLSGKIRDLPEMTQQSSPATEVLDFLNSIEGAGYGGMASFEIARAHVRDMVGEAATPRGAPEPLSLQAVREDERMACWKIAEAERASAVANAIKARGYPLPSTDDK